MKKKLLNLMKGVTLSFILGASSVSMGQTGSALDFDRVNDYVNLGTAITNSLANQNKFTLEAWVKPSVTFTSGAYGDVVGNYNTLNSTPPMQFMLRGNNGVWSFFAQAAGSFTQVNSGTFVVNQWQHVAATWDGTVGSIYVNGVLSNTASMAGTGFTTATNPVWIGGNAINNEYFGGDIDEVRIWNRVLCPAELQNNMNGELPLSQYALLAYYKFNQGVAAGNNAGITTLTDYGPASVTGTLTNFALTGGTSNWVTPGGVINGSLAPAYMGGSVTVNSGSINPGQTFTMNPSGAPSYTFSSGSSTVAPNVSSTYTVYGYAGGCLNKAVSTVSVSATCLNFDGVNDVVNLGTSVGATLSTLNKITVEAWVRPTNLTGSGPIISNYSYPNNQMQFLLRREGSTNYSWWIGNGNGNAYLGVNSTAAPTLNVWQHLVGVWNGTVSSIYINGVLSGTASVTYPAFGVTTNSLAIGYENAGGGEKFMGDIDEVRIWTRVLCPAEFQNNMNGQLVLPQNGLLSYYQFNEGFSGLNNAGINTLSDMGPAGATGTLNSMALTGMTSNWMSPAAFAYGATAPTFTIPSFAIAGPSLICMGSSATFTASGVNTYSWSNGALTSTVMVSPTVNATYSVIGTATTGCMAQLTKSVAVAALPSVSAVTSETNMLCSGQSATLSASGASTYVWNTTATTAVIVISPTVTTSYTVTGTDGNGCQNTATVTQNVSNCTGIAVNQQEQLLSIYPNPTSGNFTIQLSADASMQISDLSGRAIYSGQLQKGEYKFDLSSYQNGIYFVQLRGNALMKTYKLVKQ